MRTLKEQGLNYYEGRFFGGAENKLFPEFVDETAPFANDGTQLVERCGLADIYYAMLHLLNRAGMTPNQMTENQFREPRPGVSPSQIVQALETLFPDKETTNDTLDSHTGTLRVLTERITATRDGLIEIIEANYGTKEESNTALKNLITNLAREVLEHYQDQSDAYPNSNHNLRDDITDLQKLNSDKIYRKVYFWSSASELPEYPTLVSPETLAMSGIRSYRILNISCICIPAAIGNPDQSLRILSATYMATPRTSDTPSRDVGIVVTEDTSSFSPRNIYLTIDYLSDN